MCFNDFDMCFNDLFNDLSSSSNNLERDTYEGAGRFSAPPPFVGILSQIVQTGA